MQDVGHAVWSFSIPEMLRPYFLFHRELLTELARAGYETVHELMAAAVEDSNVRVGMVASIQTFSDNLKWNPHLHSIVSRGVWRDDGQWIPVPYIDTHAAEILFREKIFRLLQVHDLLSDERIKILRSWRRSGFSTDNDVYLYPSDTQALESLSRYIVRCPVSLQRLRYDKKSNYVLYQPKSKNRKAELLDPLEFLARVLIHIFAVGVLRSSPATSDSLEAARMRTISSPTSIRSCTTVTTPDEQENIPERNDLHLTTTSSTPLSVKPFADDGPT